MAPETLYDHPLYYDILFGFDRSREAEFLHRTLVRCGILASEPVLEVACGPGRVARLLARRGWKLTGLDRGAAMLALAREQASAEATPLADPRHLVFLLRGKGTERRVRLGRLERSYVAR